MPDNNIEIDNETIETAVATPPAGNAANDAQIDADGRSDEPEGDGITPEPDGDTFPRRYVEQIRQESHRYRQRAQRADDLAQRLHVELVRATGRLADPTDLAFDEAHLDDADALATAVEDLLHRKPHLGTRRPVGDIGQGATASAATVDLAAILRSRAG